MNGTGLQVTGNSFDGLDGCAIVSFCFRIVSRALRFISGNFYSVAGAMAAATATAVRPS